MGRQARSGTSSEVKKMKVTDLLCNFSGQFQAVLTRCVVSL